MIGGRGSPQFTVGGGRGRDFLGSNSVLIIAITNDWVYAAHPPTEYTHINVEVQKFTHAGTNKKQGCYKLATTQVS